MSTAHQRPYMQNFFQSLSTQFMPAQAPADTLPSQMQDARPGHAFMPLHQDPSSDPDLSKDLSNGQLGKCIYC